MTSDTETTFEEQIGRLEEIVRTLDEGDLPLEQSLKLFEEGVVLARRCSARLTEAQGKLESLIAGQNGAIKVEEIP